MRLNLLFSAIYGLWMEARNKEEEYCRPALEEEIRKSFFSFVIYFLTYTLYSFVHLISEELWAKEGNHQNKAQLSCLGRVRHMGRYLPLYVVVPRNELLLLPQRTFLLCGRFVFVA